MRGAEIGKRHALSIYCHCIAAENSVIVIVVVLRRRAQDRPDFEQG